MTQAIQLTLTLEEAKFITAAVGFAVATVGGNKTKADGAVLLMAISKDAIDTVMPKMGLLVETIISSLPDERAHG